MGITFSNDIKVISIIPYRFHFITVNGQSVVNYNVKYNFKVHGGSGHYHNHIQIFDWRAIFNSNDYIVKSNSLKIPSKDYDE